MQYQQTLTTTTRKRGLPVAAGLLAVTLSITACGSNDDEVPSVEPTPGQTTSPEEPLFTEVPPQVGSGDGLATTDYVPLDQQALSTVRTNDAVDDSDPAQVLVRGLEKALAWEPADDSTQFEAFVRASSAFNNTYLRSQETRLATLIPMSSRDWEAWGDRDLVFAPTVTLTNEDHPKDTGSDFSRVVTIDMSTTSVDNPDAGKHVLTIIGQARVHNTTQGWRIETFEVRDTVLGQG